MVTECDSKPNGIGPTETGEIAQTVEDCLEREGCVCEACGSSWTTEAIERGLALISDPISRPFFKGQPKLVEYLINLVRNHGKSPHHDDIVVKDMSQQVVISNANGHSAQLDIVARDENDKIYNIEFQSRRESALAQRSFFYAALLFLEAFKSGVDYKDCPKACVIFFLENGEGCNGKLVECVTPVDTSGNRIDWPIEVYLINGALNDESELGIILQDMRCKNLHALRNSKLKERMDKLLYQHIGRKEMCEAQEKWENELLERGREEGLEKGREEGLEKGREEGREEGSMQRLIEMTKRIMTHLGKTLDDAMAFLQLTEDEKVSVRLCMATS